MSEIAEAERLPKADGSTGHTTPTNHTTPEAEPGHLRKADTFSTVGAGDREGGASTAATSPKKWSFWSHLNEDVDPNESTGPLAAYCFMTGYIDVISFSAIFVWCGFQTGNFAQLGLALARLFDGSHGHRMSDFHIADRQALTSLITFNMGAFVGRLGDRIGAQKRIWLITGTFLQALLTMAAAVTLYKSGQDSVSDQRAFPTWTNALSYVALGFMSASLGVQGIQAKRLNTQFTTTIVLTTVWVELVTDPDLFNFMHKVKTRDHKLIAATALFLGAFIGRAILGAVGSPAALGVGCGLRVLVSMAWFFVPNKRKN